ncbi:ABC transporter substrate-binding protein [Oceanobacillus halophilus]|uniref:Carbohydrate ABC transporter substrate-binding protein n=1 Tax=Oceanobacillus halophilus TaxID=930130 RepID=A0A494ZUY2_9BACI|nr:ABC transporter substrate-binding protein [Oceanobacillus halophilus]RKQ30228.1 carbohydrate ABC transporter substrate-binding protein [Oceanobacillus halophilus]
MKKWKILFAAVLLTMVLSACSGGSADGASDDGGDPDAITAWAWDPLFNIAALELAEEQYVQEAGDFQLDIIDNAQKDIVQKLNTGLSSGTMNGMPNIVLIEDYRAQSFLQAYPDAFYDMSEHVNIDDFAEYKKAPTSFDGKQYGIPFDTGVTGLYLRTDYLEEAGYTPEDLTNITWDEYIEIGKDITEKTGKKMISLNPNDPDHLRHMIQTAGTWFTDEDGETVNMAGNEAVGEALRVFKTMLDEDIAHTNSDWSSRIAAFNSGDIVSVATGNWMTPSVKAEESQSGNWTVVPIPRLSVDGAVNASNVGGSSFYVLNIPGKEQAAEFLASTFGSDTALYQDLVTEIGAIGTYLPALEGEAFNQEDEFFAGQNINADFVKWMMEIPNVNYGMHTYASTDILIGELQNYRSGKALEEVLEDAQKQAEAQLN